MALKENIRTQNATALPTWPSQRAETSTFNIGGGNGRSKGNHRPNMMVEISANMRLKNDAEGFNWGGLHWKFALGTKTGQLKVYALHPPQNCL